MVIVGSNGTGKTTIVNTIAGLIKPKSGNVFFEGKNVTNIFSKVLLLACHAS